MIIAVQSAAHKYSDDMKTFVSDLSGRRFPIEDRISGESVRLSIMGMIQHDHPDFDASKYMSLQELNSYRGKYIAEYLQKEVGNLGNLDSKVLKALKNQSTISDKLAVKANEKLSTGEMVADKVASFGGSWTFIIMFACILAFWVVLNVVWLGGKAFDPYPFILMNLVLSCLAAIQAPIIMMSQNRQSKKDRKHAESDYMVNLKSEIEIRSLHEKLDHLMLYQQQELIEIQKIQIEMLTDIQKEFAKCDKTKNGNEPTE